MLLCHYITANAITKNFVKNVRIRSFSGLYFPVFSSKTEKYGPEKLQITTLLTQWNLLWNFCLILWILKKIIHWLLRVTGSFLYLTKSYLKVQGQVYKYRVMIWFWSALHVFNFARCSRFYIYRKWERNSTYLGLQA